MPQMSPLMWDYLFLFFLMTYMLFFINIYSFSLIKIKYNKKNFILLNFKKMKW